MSNKDLIWDLEKFKKRKRAQEFVLGFENKLCVYSGSVEQLYTNYNIFFPKEENRKLVILPNPYSPHDNFHGIPESAVRPTGLFIVPSTNNEGSSALSMILPLKSGTAQRRKVPLEVGLSLINKKLSPDRPFLPIVMKGDLRELDADTPCLHLNMLQLSQLDRLSGMEKMDIQKVIIYRLEELAKRK